MNRAHFQILQKYHVSPDARLGRGMEAEAYAYGPDKILKIYAGTAGFADLCSLKEFYDGLTRHLLPYELPQIHWVAQEEGCLVTIEQRLAGTPMAALLPSLNATELEEMMRRYLAAVCALSQLHLPPAFKRYKLFDPDRISRQEDGDWHQFLGRFLKHKLLQVTPYLSRDVPHFASKVEQLERIWSRPYSGDYRLIHGDFFPGNLLIDEEYRVTALLDFGLLTMYGDKLFDLATSWVFFDMYDELKAQARDRLLALIVGELGEQILGRLVRYVLIYSILSANTYSATCSDGHYRWCVANLSNRQYWDVVE